MTEQEFGEYVVKYKISEETRIKMSLAHKGKKLSEDTIKKRSLKQKGLKRTEETKRKISKGLQGRKLSEETKIKLSKINKGQKRKGKENYIYYNDVNYKEKLAIQKTKEKNNNWKDGIHINKEGRKLILIDNKKYQYEHRLIAEKVLGRNLKTNEIIHHIDLDVTNNKNNNLLICSISYHKYLHHKIKKLNWILNK